MKKNLIYGTMALLFVLVVCISSAAAQGTVTRALPESASAGETITVDLTVVVDGEMAYIIDETVPSGWTVTNATGAGDYITNPGHITWFEVSLAPIPDTVYSYTVEVPADASGAYIFNGTYMFEGMPGVATIHGPDTVTVGTVPVPATTPIGIAALVGLLGLIGAGIIMRRR